MGANDEPLWDDQSDNDIYGDEKEALCDMEAPDEMEADADEMEALADEMVPLADEMEAPQDNAVVAPPTYDATAEPLIINDNTDNTPDKGPICF